MNLGSGWDCGGAWVTSEHAAKKLAGQETVVQGPGRTTVALPQPETVQGFYRDIAVLAHPMPGGESPQRGQEGIWDRSRIVDLTKSTDEQGRLTWDVPAGAWRVLRIGYTLHGKPIQCVGSGLAGLEIDPMEANAMDAHFAETGAKLIADAGPLAANRFSISTSTVGNSISRRGRRPCARNFRSA